MPFAQKIRVQVSSPINAQRLTQIKSRVIAWGPSGSLYEDIMIAHVGPADLYEASPFCFNLALRRRRS